MKQFLYSLVSALLCIALIVGVVFIMYDGKTPTTQNGTIIDDGGTGNGVTDDSGMDEDVKGDPSNGDGLNGGVDEPQETEQKPLKDPTNVTELLADGMEMMSGASIYIGDDETIDPAIRFTCLIENTLLNEIEADSTKQAGILMAPLDYFDAVNPNNYTYMDWVNEFETAGKTYMLSLFDGYKKYDSDTSYVRFDLANVLYKNINRKFVALGVVITTNGGAISYRYSTLETNVDYRTNARSVSYVASAALNAHALGLENFNADQLSRLKSYINMSVDHANGLVEPTNDGSMYALNVISGATKTLAVGETFTLETERSPKIEAPIWYRSSDTSVLTVDDTGKVTAVKSGVATIRIFLAGVEYGVTVTVT